MTKALLLVLMVIALGGCATAEKMNRLSVGMEKDEALKALGSPESTYSPAAGSELLRYSLTEQAMGWPVPYGVIVMDGKVAKYGRMDDLFPPTQEELAQRRAAAMQILQMYQSTPRAPAAQDTYTPMPTYQPKQQNTNCTTYYFGGTARTSCTTGGGIDTSIYR